MDVHRDHFSNSETNIQMVEMKFLCRAAGFTSMGKSRNTEIGTQLKIKIAEKKL